MKEGKKIKHIIIIGLLILCLSSIVGCISNDKMYSGDSLELQGSYQEYLAAEGRRTYFISAGQSPKDTNIKETIYSNRVRPVEGSIRFSGYDIVPLDSSVTQDKQDELQSFFAEFIHPESGDLYSIIITNLMEKTDFESFGGIGINKMIHGDTGIGTNLLPKTFAYMVILGQANIIKNGVIVEKRVPIEVFVSQGIRNDVEKTLLNMRDPYDKEIHMILPGQYGDDKVPLISSSQGFFYLYFEDVDIYRHTIGTRLPDKDYHS